MKDILVIGTEPQCPRCKLLLNIIRDMNNKYGWGASIRHCAFDTDEAQIIARNLDLRANTAKEVAILLDKPMDKEKINKLCTEVTTEANSVWAELNDCNWSQELDDEIRPYQEKAREVGILMTPILVVDGEVLWEGSVPNKETLYKLFDINQNK